MRGGGAETDNQGKKRGVNRVDSMISWRKIGSWSDVIPQSLWDPMNYRSGTLKSVERRERSNWLIIRLLHP